MTPRAGAGRESADGRCPSCAVCTLSILTTERASTWVWTDPGGEVCCAHVDCLIRIGEFDHSTWQDR